MLPITNHMNTIVEAVDKGDVETIQRIWNEQQKQYLSLLQDFVCNNLSPIIAEYIGPSILFSEKIYSLPMRDKKYNLYAFALKINIAKRCEPDSGREGRKAIQEFLLQQNTPFYQGVFMINDEYNAFENDEASNWPGKDISAWVQKSIYESFNKNPAKTQLDSAYNAEMKKLDHLEVLEEDFLPTLSSICETFSVLFIMDFRTHPEDLERIIQKIECFIDYDLTVLDPGFIINAQGTVVTVNVVHEIPLVNTTSVIYLGAIQKALDLIERTSQLFHRKLDLYYERTNLISTLKTTQEKLVAFNYKIIEQRPYQNEIHFPPPKRFWAWARK